jgi:pimeloyl-ACP methyl ester carboxylesterase
VSRVLSSRRRAAITLALAAAFVGTLGATTDSSSSAGRAAIAWTPCGKTFECAKLAVPVDAAKPDGRQLRLALVRLPASNPSSRIGSLVVNPGGPGVSGVDWVRSRSGRLSTEVRARFDVVGFDPRGVGHSSPVVCRTAAQRDQEMSRAQLPRTAAERAAVIADAKRFAQGCMRQSGNLLPYLTTEATARDLDRLRAALGDSKLTYLGFSYGTVLGATYASLFPGKVRALVLDGAADPEVWAGDAAGLLRAQAVGMHRERDAFLSWCRSHRSECSLADNGDPEEQITRMLARLRTHPLVVNVPTGKRLLTERQAVTAIAAAMYSSQAWPLLGSIAGDLSYDDGRLLLYLADAYTERNWDGTYTNLQDAYTAISCVDHAPASRDPAHYARLAAEFTRISPIDGGLLGYEQLPCAFWPVKAASRYTGPFHARGAPPIVVVGTTGDPATPYVWAKALASELDSGVLLTRVGDGHTAYGVSACVRGHVDRYLLALSAPPNRTVCQS